jgi:hypothetical protein
VIADSLCRSFEPGKYQTHAPFSAEDCTGRPCRAVSGPVPARADDGLTPSAIVSQVNDQLAGLGWVVASAEVTGTTRIDRNGDRIVVQEFAARARATETFFQRTRLVEALVLIAPTVQPGDGFDLRGEAITLVVNGTTETRVTVLNVQELSYIGLARAEFEGANRTVLIDGTPEADAALAALARARAEAEAAAEAARQAEIARLADLYRGDWVSLGQCGSITFQHRIQLQPTDHAGRFAGSVTYRPIYPNPPFEFGSYEAIARHDARRDRLVIELSRWTERPRGNRAVTITLTAQGDGAALIGESSNLLGFGASGTCRYRLQRPTAHEAEREAVRAPVRAFLARIETGVWQEGNQTGPGRDGRTDWPVRVRVNSVSDDYILATAELTAFHANSNLVLGEMEMEFAVFLVNGLDGAWLEFGRRPPVRGRDVRNLYSRSNQCPALDVSLDVATGVLTGTHGDRNGCISALTLLLTSRQ